MRYQAFSRILAGLLLVGACGCGSALEGRWKVANNGGSLIVYPDNTVSLYGVGCHWTEIDGTTIRIERCLSEIRDESGQPIFPFAMAAHLTADFRLADDRNHAILSVLLFNLKFERAQ